MKFLFYCDENEEAAVLQEMFSKWSGVSVESRAKQYGIPADVAALCGREKDVSQRLKDFLHEKYVLYAAELELSLKFHTRFGIMTAAVMLKQRKNYADLFSGL